jgi:hypothetical protein
MKFLEQCLSSLLALLATTVKAYAKAWRCMQIIRNLTGQVKLGMQTEV